MDTLDVLEANKEVVRRHFEELFNERRIELIQEITDREMVNHASMPFPTTRTAKGGPKPYGELREAVLLLCEAFPDLEFTIEDMIAEGDKVVARVTMRGTHTWKFQGIPPTGRYIEVQHIHIFRVRDGKTAEHWVTRDDLTMMQQMGLVSPPAADAGGLLELSRTRPTG